MDQTALEGALGKADVATVGVFAEADAPPALVLAALTTKTGPHVAQRFLVWQGLNLKVLERRPTTSRFGDPKPASIFSWRANGAMQLWSIATESALTNLGPFEPGDEKAEPSVIVNLSKACAATGCLLDVELREESLQRDLQVWQHIALAVGSPLGLHVRRPTPLPPSSKRQYMGYLPPDVIQAVVRLGFHTLKGCYEEGLSRDHKLEGRVSVSFVIERDGSVKNARDGGSDMSDAAVRDCVVRKFLGFKFPPPDDGIVTVVYPIMLAPG
ncbi:MAG TPA: AgmX/PglI C-terminal domain-containing protein [Polyangiaceae bacterium]|nr:AgmX/PglI C-terminal domain-containing protein [Polyangiaceae bacterium]